MNRVVLLTLLSLTPGVLVPVAMAAETCESHGIAYNCVTEHVEQQENVIPYQDGSVGSVPTNTTTTSFDSWPVNITTESGANYTYVTSGVQMGAVHELHATFYTNNGTLATPANHTVVFFGATTQLYSVPVWSEQIHFNAADIMNGASRFVWRSPLSWDTNWTSHAVVIRDAVSNEIVGGDLYTAGGGYFSGGSGTVVGGRVYHVIEAPIRTSHTYTVNEFVGIPVGQPGLNHVTMALANGADLGSDANKQWFLFAGTAAGLAYDIDEAGWGVVFLRGLGAAGIERLVIGDSALPTVVVSAQRQDGVPGANPNVVEVTIPLRTSAPLNITGTLNVYVPDNSAFASYPFTLTNVTGIAMVNVSITATGASAGQSNHYQMSYHFNLSTGQAMTYLMYDDTTLVPHFASTCANYPTGYCTFEAPAFAAWYEVHEYTVASPPVVGTATDKSFHLFQFLLGAGELVLGGALIALGSAGLFVTAPTGVGILPSAAAIALGFAVASYGTVNLGYGLGIIGDQQYQDMQNVLANLGRGVLGFIATAACVASIIATPPVVSVPVCVLAGAVDLWALGVPVFEILKNAVEVVGQILGALLGIIDFAIPLFTLLLTIYALVIPVKVALLIILGGVLSITAWGTDPRKHKTFKMFRDAFYIPVWTELVEQQFGLFHAKGE